MAQLQAIRGMRDVLPEEARRWRAVESAVETALAQYAYEEVHLPLVEFTELFTRSVGEATDIVEKEMYTFTDRDGAGIALRPEGTAGCVRALQQHGLLFNQTQRVFYRGPMFRYERPQKGRYRQFYQIGAEAFGLPGPDVDAELIAVGRACWQALGIEDQVWLEVNTLGSSECRAKYRHALVDYLGRYQDDLDEDSRRRLGTNPLRILDSKVVATREILNDAPRLIEYVDAESREHFEALCGYLEDLGIAFKLNDRLVRGLDYYTHGVFEWITEALGAQGTICAGGRYDGLVENLGGKPTPGAGFGIGLERVLLLHEQRNLPSTAAADVYCCAASADLRSQVMVAAERLRAALPELRIRVHAGGGKLKNQLKKADQCGARWALIIGEDEARDGTLTLKTLRGERSSDNQRTLGMAGVVEALSSPG